MGMYRREAFVERRRSAVRLPLVVGMGAVAAFMMCAVISSAVPSALLNRTRRDEILIFWLAFASFTLCAYAARVVLDALLQRRLLRRQLLVVGAGMRAWDLSRMLTKEGSSLNYDITFLHDPALGPIDPRLQC